MVKGQLKSKAPGIYFGMPDEEYRGDPAMSYSSAKTLLTDSRKFWLESHYNKDRNPKKTTAPMKLGKAAHRLLLEPEKFDSEWEVKHGVKSSSLDMTLGDGEYTDLLDAIDYLMSLKNIRHLFKGGYPEVSIFWQDEESGVNWKCRHDYITHLITTDYKTTADINKYVLRYVMANNQYDLQSGVYLEGIRVVKKLLREGRGVAIGSVDKGWLNEFTKSPDHRFVLCFQEKAMPYLVRSFEVLEDVERLGRSKFEEASRKFKDNVEEYGVSYPWPSDSVAIETLGIDDLPEKSFYI